MTLRRASSFWSVANGLRINICDVWNVSLRGDV